jgi:predicted enzyme related to lactoylglutathione lyase
MTSSMHGHFIWYDLMTPDPKAAQAFYTGVVGWKAQDSGVPGQSYTILSVGETGVGGLMELTPEACSAGAKPMWNGYIMVDDVDTYANRVTKAGGTVHRAPEDIPTIGRFAPVSDPHGAPFILFKPMTTEAPSPRPAPGTPGTAAWRELYAGNLDKEFSFYSGLFGWTKAEAHDMGPMGTYQLFAIDGEQSGGMMTKPPQVPAPSWNYYFNVDAIDAAAERVKKKGGQIINGPMEVPGGSWIIQGMDPQGAMFSLLASKR